MKNLIVILLITCQIHVFAQNTFNYSFKLSNNGNLLTNKYVLIKTEIIKVADSEKSEYTESHTATSNSLGIVTLNIGNGIPITGKFPDSFSQNHTYFLKIDYDIRDGNGFRHLGTFQIFTLTTAKITENNQIIPTLTANEIKQIQPTEGLVIYNLNSHAINYFNGSQWKEISGTTLSQVSTTTTNNTNNSVLTQYQNIKLTGQPGSASQYGSNKMFYSASQNKTYTASEAESQAQNIDLVFLYQRENGYIFCSPDASYITEIFSFNAYNYNNNNKRHTKIQKVDNSWELIDSKTLDLLQIYDQKLENGKGTGVTNLRPDDLIAFETANGKKGIIKIKPGDRTLFSVTFDIKVK